MIVLTVVKRARSRFDGYGECHADNLSVCVMAHAEVVNVASDPGMHELIERLAVAPVAPLALAILEHTAEEFAKHIVADINDSRAGQHCPHCGHLLAEAAADLSLLLRRMLETADTRFAIDVLTTDDLVRRKTSGRRNSSGLHTEDPTEDEIP